MTSLNNGFSAGFDLRRVVGTTRGLLPDVDPLVTQELATLESTLGRRIFASSRGDVIGASQSESGSAKKRDTSSIPKEINDWQFLTLQLSPRHITGPSWPDGSLLGRFMSEAPGDDKRTLSEVVDAQPGLSSLKYAFTDLIGSSTYTLKLEERTILTDYPTVTDFLLSYAFFEMGLTDVNAVKSFILNSPAGLQKISDYTVISAARVYIDQKKLEIPQLDNDNSSIVANLKNAHVSFDADVFTGAVYDVVDDPIFNSKESALLTIAAGNLGALQPDWIPALIKYIQDSNTHGVTITNKNVTYFVAGWLQQLARSTIVFDLPSATSTADQSVADFDVDLLDDDRTTIQVSRGAVRCAAQLYYGMILGKELEIFNVMNHFTHKYLVRGGMTINDSKLRDDLQSYVFSNRFMDVRTNRMMDRTRPAERAMFYRQVFNYGPAQLHDDVVVNGEFPKLWKVLMLESAKFLERAQISPNPDNYVSRQNVMQSAEDLQYNLSTHCTGMSNVIAPLIYAELNFVIHNIFMHKEVLAQVAPANGIWWRVVETLYVAMKGYRPKSTVLYNKAKGGLKIIQQIADYDSSAFANDQTFAVFISEVEHFITTQSILQEALTDDVERAGASGDAPMPAAVRKPAGGETPEKATPAGQEWNF